MRSEAVLNKGGNFASLRDNEMKSEEVLNEGEKFASLRDQMKSEDQHPYSITARKFKKEEKLASMIIMPQAIWNHQSLIEIWN
ncbi:hypothetical protein DPMN_094482 [Dreissena polymorpha]|uniref:Uncharacterized protein n=1 Tax=Dreissena polymorpha TaxID=45954 RepID=A0A9D4L563_DREPO|nr:hypothetical protein DPMN_094482 [Dreissena polymorpha]